MFWGFGKSKLFQQFKKFSDIFIIHTSLTLLFIYAFIYLFLYLFMPLFIYFFIYLFLYLFIPSFIYPFIYLFIPLYIYSLLYLFIPLIMCATFVYKYLHKEKFVSSCDNIHILALAINKERLFHRVVNFNITGEV